MKPKPIEATPETSRTPPSPTLPDTHSGDMPDEDTQTREIPALTPTSTTAMSYLDSRPVGIATASTSGASVSNALLSTNDVSWGPANRLEVATALETGVFFLLATAHIIHFKCCNENTKNSLKKFFLLFPVFLNCLTFTYDTSCRIAAILDSTSNVALGSILSVSTLFGGAVAFGQSSEPDSRWHILSGAAFSGVAIANSINNIGRFWNFFPVEDNHYYDHSITPDGHPINLATFIFATTAVAVGTCVALACACQGKGSNLLARIAAPINTLLYDFATACETFLFKAPAATILLAAKYLGFICHVMLNKYCIKQPSDESNMKSLAEPLMDNAVPVSVP